MHTPRGNSSMVVLFGRQKMLQGLFLVIYTFFATVVLVANSVKVRSQNGPAEKVASKSNVATTVDEHRRFTRMCILLRLV